MWVLEGDIRPRKVRRNKGAGKRMVTIFLIKSSLIKSIPLESTASISAHWYVSNRFCQAVNIISQR